MYQLFISQLTKHNRDTELPAQPLQKLNSNSIAPSSEDSQLIRPLRQHTSMEHKQHHLAQRQSSLEPGEGSPAGFNMASMLNSVVLMQVMI